MKSQVVVARKYSLVSILPSPVFHLRSPFTMSFLQNISGPQCFRLLSIKGYWNNVVGLAASWVNVVDLRHSN